MKTGLALLLFLLLFNTALQRKSCNDNKSPTTENRQTTNSVPNKKEIKNVNENRAKNVKTLPEGVWGGQHIILYINENGATLEYDCAHGTIDHKIEIDHEGKFYTTGTHEIEKGGPTQNTTAANEDGIVSSNNANDGVQKVRYTGSVNEKNMTLTVTLANSGKTIGTFNLIKDEMPKLKKCL